MQAPPYLSLSKADNSVRDPNTHLILITAPKTNFYIKSNTTFHYFLFHFFSLALFFYSLHHSHLRNYWLLSSLAFSSSFSPFLFPWSCGKMEHGGGRKRGKHDASSNNHSIHMFSRNTYIYIYI